MGLDRKLLRRSRLLGSLPFLFSALALFVLTALPWTPPARPERDMAFSGRRRACAVGLKRGAPDRSGWSGADYDWDITALVSAWPPALASLPSSASSTAFGARFSAPLLRARRSRGPPTA